MRILYLAPLIPAESGNGGKRAVLNHLLDLLRSKPDIDLFVVDVEGHGESLSPSLKRLSARVFPRSIRRGTGLVGKLLAILQLLVDIRPRAVAVVTSYESRKAVAQALATRCYDHVVVDHLNAWGLLDGIVVNCPVSYIAHNIEYDVLVDHARQHSPLSPWRWLLILEGWKMRNFERYCCARATTIINIFSGTGRASNLAPLAAKTVFWPELPEIRAAIWHPLPARRLLFVGSAKYFPNREAIEWLVTMLMPELVKRLPDLVLHLAGTAQCEMPHLAAIPNVVFEGFVPVLRLEQLHREASLFVSPVVLGSGIKIKVLDAASYGLPIAATTESLAGINFLRGAALVFPREPRAAAELIADAFERPEFLTEACRATIDCLREARRLRPPLISLLRVI